MVPETEGIWVPTPPSWCGVWFLYFFFFAFLFFAFLVKRGGKKKEKLHRTPGGFGFYAFAPPPVHTHTHTPSCTPHFCIFSPLRRLASCWGGKADRRPQVLGVQARLARWDSENSKLANANTHTHTILTFYFYFLLFYYFPPLLFAFLSMQPALETLSE